MRDDPRRNVLWMQQQLMESEETEFFDSEDDDLMERLDALLEDFSEEEKPVSKFRYSNRDSRLEKSPALQPFDPASAVFTKSKKQLRREAKLQRKEKKKAQVNDRIWDLVLLAVLECIGILAILGWWLQ